MIVKYHIRKWVRDSNRHSQKASQHMKWGSTSLVNRQMQLTILRYHYTPTRRAKIKITDNTTCSLKHVWQWELS